MLKVWQCHLRLTPPPDREDIDWKSAMVDAYIPAESQDEAEIRLKDGVQKLGLNLVNYTRMLESPPSPPSDPLGQAIWNRFRSELEPILEEERRFARLAERTREVQFGEFTTSRRADPSAEIEPSPGLREVLCLSEKEARRLGHKFIKPEHYLLAILGINECVAVQVLRGLGVDPHQLREDLETDLHPRRETEGFVSSPAPSVAAEQLIQAAKDIANQLRHGWYGTAHLLLALIREEGLLPGKVLRRFGVSYAAAHEETRGMLTPFRGQWVLDPKPE